MSLTTSEIRRIFLDFFKARDHETVPGLPLVPPHDPTLMFTNAGMVQFKDIFTGKKAKVYNRAASVQKCIRISGKHNDLENVGRTSRHHTFFEMLGNFSFGDYFKKNACVFGWELLTKEYGLDPDRLWVSVFGGTDSIPADDEAAEIWREVVGVPGERIFRLGLKDNFWAMGDTGPCGPCSEILYDRGESFGKADPANGERFFELWNLVFMQFNVKTAGGEMEPLPDPSIDTGAGLERIASVLQEKNSNYDIDVFLPVVEKAAGIAGKTYGKNADDDVSLRVIADHSRMTAFVVAEGVFPEKTGREYVLRRVMRRAIRHGHRLGISDLFLHSTAAAVIKIMGDDYPELVDRADLIDKICRQEETRFRTTLQSGMDILNGLDEWIEKDGSRYLPGEVAFDLTATYGFPRDLIEVIGKEDGFMIDKKGFDKAASKHRMVSGTGKIGEEEIAPVYRELRKSLESPTEFSGRRTLRTTAKVVAVSDGKSLIDRAGQGLEILLITDVTPFYAESGGQVGDRGTAFSDQGDMTRINDTQSPVEGLTVHKGKVEKGSVSIGDSVTLEVDASYRDAVKRNHTATHILHWALRHVIGPHALQKGSRVGAMNLRFDFAHTETLSREQLDEIERVSNEIILDNNPVVTDEITAEEAKSRGATALFEEHYGDIVRMVQIADRSMELCGGIHAESTAEIGQLRIVSESGVAAGVRRIEAVTGMQALKYAMQNEQTLREAAQMLKGRIPEVPAKISRLIEREKDLARECERMKKQLAMGTNQSDPMSSAREVEGIRVLSMRIPVADPATLRDTADSFRDRIKSGVVCLGGESGGKASLVITITRDLVDRLNAGEIIRPVAAVVGGGGGGRPDMAQAGGPDVEKLDTALEAVYEEVQKRVR